MNGVEFMNKLKDLKYDIPVVFLTTIKDVSFAVEVMRMGVKDYLLLKMMLLHLSFHKRFSGL